MPDRLTDSELDFRKELARVLIAAGRTELDDAEFVDTTLLPPEAMLTAELNIPFPAGLAPVPQEITPKPSPTAKLPAADVVVVTWTVAEQNALADTLTPGFGRMAWYSYSRNWDTKYAVQSRRGSPASKSKRLGSYFMTKIGNKTVMCFKSEFHLNQDGVRNFNGTDQTSLPVRDMFIQIIEETKCSHILTVGTCGGIKLEHDLGDVLVTRGARFKCSDEFENATFNNKSYTSDWEIPTKFFAKAEELMQPFAKNLQEPEFGPPTKRHTGVAWKLDRKFKPNIIHAGGDSDTNSFEQFHPILTTDFFEFGHSKNADELWEQGCGVEMGDAVLGLVCTDDIPNPPKWAVIRNISDPQINGDLTDKPRALNMQAHWAVWYYEAYGYYTSVMSSLTTWAIVAGLNE